MRIHKIIFLDIDGVLVTSRCLLATAKYPTFDSASCKLVGKICQLAPARIVICSAWREQRTRPAFQAILLRNGIPKHRLHEDWATPVLGGSRSREVRGWLEVHPEVSHYAIVDDGIGLDDESSHLVAPNPDWGVGIKEVIEICALLDINFAKWFRSCNLKPSAEELELYARRQTHVPSMS